MAKRRFTEEEARKRKNARQREYAKRTHHAANIKSQKANSKRYVLQMTISTDSDIIEKLDSEKAKDGYATYIKRLIREDIAKQQKLPIFN